MKRKLLALMLAGTLVLGQAPAVLAADGYEPQAGDYASEEMYEEDTEENFQERPQKGGYKRRSSKPHKGICI